MPIKFVVSGHVDHGKSTLCGHLLYKSGYINEHEMDKLREEAKIKKMPGWEYAFILDIYEGERESGKTHEFNKIEFTYNNMPYTLIDTPGHKQLIRNLIQGLNNETQLVGCLIVSAKENEFNTGITNGQTKEDALLIRSVGIEHLIVIINKMDLHMALEADQYQNLFNAKCDHLKKIVGKLKFKTVQYIDVSAVTGHHLTQLLDLIGTTWSSAYETSTNVSMSESETVTVPAQIVPILSHQHMTCKLWILNSENIITSGYQGVLHNKDKEMEIIIDDLRVISESDGKITKNTIAKMGNLIYAKVRRTDGLVINYRVGDRVIFRKNDYTIGPGTVMK